MLLRVRLLRDGAILPDYAYSGDSGFDLYLPVGGEDIVVPSGGWVKVDLGLSVELASGYELQLRSKSGLSLRHGLFMLNGIGTIDSGYRGELSALVGNFGTRDYVFRGGDKVCQGVISRVEHCEIRGVDDLSESVRGRGGFGSSGTVRGGCSSCRGL